MKSKNIRNNALEPNADNELVEIPPFDFSKARRASFAEQARNGATTVVHNADGTQELLVRLDADVAKKFRSAKSVNAALRKLLNHA
jgi:uncharacterized protein (DUF4415 family)